MYKELVDKLRTESLYKDKATLEIMDLCMDAAEAIDILQSELERVKSERDAAMEAIGRMAEYIVTYGRVDYMLCDDIPNELHLKYQPLDDGNYDNEPCIECVREHFMRMEEKSNG